MIINDGTKKPLGKRVDMNGNEFIMVYFPTSVPGVKKTGIPITKGANGWTAEALFNATTTVNYNVFIGFPEQAVATLNYGWCQVGGHISGALIASTTAALGDAVIFSTATLKSAGTTTITGNAFGVFDATGTTGTSQSIRLFGEMIETRG